MHIPGRKPKAAVSDPLNSVCMLRKAESMQPAAHRLQQGKNQNTTVLLPWMKTLSSSTLFKARISTRRSTSRPALAMVSAS